MFSLSVIGELLQQFILRHELKLLNFIKNIKYLSAKYQNDGFELPSLDEFYHLL